MYKKGILILIFVLLIYISFAQIVEKASIMTIRDPYGSAQIHHLYKPLKNGNKILTGRIGYSIHYNNWNVTNPDTLPGLKNYIAMFSSNDSLLWVKYISAPIQTFETDSKNNIYLTGSYKGLLNTSDRDTLPLLSNNLNYVGNVFIIKLDSAGNRKWWKTTDNGATGQFEPYGDYIKIDPDFNAYVSGHYDLSIKFNSQISFIRASPYTGYIPFLAKLDSNGNYKWVRDWNIDSGLPSGLSIDSCRIYMFTILGASQTEVRMRKFDFSGKLLEQKNIPYTSSELFWANNINVKNDRLVMITFEENQKKIGFFDLKGNRKWSVNYSTGIALVNLQFTNQNRIFFSGAAVGDSNKIGSTLIPGDIFWGFMDTTGNVLHNSFISKVGYTGLPFLAENGKHYINSIFNYYSNSNLNTFTLDTILFNNLTYYDSGSGIVSGIYYRLLAQYNLGDGSYFRPGACIFSPPADTCLDREGINKCSVITSANNLNTDKYFKIYPNPTNHILNLDFLGFQFTRSIIEIIDINGIVRKEIKSFLMNNKIDISFLSPGIYFIKISLPKQQYFTKKIILLK